MENSISFNTKFGWISASELNKKITSIQFKKLKSRGVASLSLRRLRYSIRAYFDGKIDAVISDMAVNTTGNKSIDSIVTGELSVEALNFSTDILKKQGCFVSKIFMRPSLNEIITIAKKE